MPSQIILGNIFYLNKTHNLNSKKLKGEVICIFILHIKLISPQHINKNKTWKKYINK